jgi:ABC-type transport system involved in multi-copper enzyme maturation permease subunit
VNGLLRAEVKRLVSRRLARVVALVFLGILLLVQVVGAVRSRDPNAEERVDIAVARQYCEDAKASGEFEPDGDCDQVYTSEDPRYNAKDLLPDAAGSVAVAAAIVGFVVGASYVGAEWAAGTMQALLFWEPRRWRVLLAKGLALVGVMVAFTVAMEVVCFATTLLVGATRGSNEGVSGVLGDAFSTAGRGLIVVTFTSLLGFAVAGLTRVTGAALGAAFVYFAILEQVVAGLRPGLFRYLIAPNIGAVMTGGLSVPAGRGEDDFGETVEILLSVTRGTLTLAVYLVIVLGAFYAVFSRRDVT